MGADGPEAQPEPGPEHDRRPRRLSGVVASLTAANAMVMVAGAVTGPLLARALGPSGRGDLAAIVVPLTLGPGILSFGLHMYAAKAAAHGRSVAALAVTIGGLSAALGVLALALAPTVASTLAHGRHTVYVFLMITFAVFPLALVGEVLRNISNALERWGLVIAARLVAPVLTLGGIVVLYVLGVLTLRSAAALTIAANLAGNLPLVAVLRKAGRPKVDLSIVKEAAVFGPKAWVGVLAQMANNRLDQLLMIPLVSSRQLGLYVVAATLASFTTILTAALGQAVFPRVARGATELPARATRVTLAVITVGVVVLGLLTPWLLPLLFGSGFKDAVPMAWVLLVAAIPAAGIPALAYALWSVDRPGAPATGELIAVGITVPGLVLLLPTMGGMGAALVSLVAYSASFAYVLGAAVRQFGHPLRQYLFVTRPDVAWAVSLARSRPGPKQLLRSRRGGDSA